MAWRLAKCRSWSCRKKCPSGSGSASESSEVQRRGKARRTARVFLAWQCCGCSRASAQNSDSMHPYPCADPCLALSLPYIIESDSITSNPIRNDFACDSCQIYGTFSCRKPVEEEELSNKHSARSAAKRRGGNTTPGSAAAATVRRQNERLISQSQRRIVQELRLEATLLHHPTVFSFSLSPLRFSVSPIISCHASRGHQTASRNVGRCWWSRSGIDEPEEPRGACQAINVSPSADPQNPMQGDSRVLLLPLFISFHSDSGCEISKATDSPQIGSWK